MRRNKLLSASPLGTQTAPIELRSMRCAASDCPGSELPGVATSPWVTRESLMTLQEAADYLRVSERFLRALARRGRIRCGRAGNRLRFRRADLLAYAGWPEERR